MHVKCLLSIFFLNKSLDQRFVIIHFSIDFSTKVIGIFLSSLFSFPSWILQFHDSSIRKLPFSEPKKKKKKEMTTARNIDNLPIAFYHLLEQHNIALSFSCSKKSLLFPFSLSVLEISNERVTVSLREIGSHRERWRRSCSPSMSPGSGIRMWPIIIAA